MRIDKNTIKSMREYANTLEPSWNKAQCYIMANYHLDKGETIAKKLYRDHSSRDGHLRAASLMVEAGCAEETMKTDGYYGKFTFNDGSTF